MDLNKEAIGKRIESIRRNLGDNMREFGERIANHLNIDLDDAPSDSIVSRWEKGKSIPNPERLKAIAELGRISVEELMYGKFKIFIADRLRNKMKSDLKPLSNDEELFSVLLNHVYSIAEVSNLSFFNPEQIDNIIDDALKIFVKVNSGPDNLSDIINDYVHSLSDVQLYPIEQLSEETRDKYNSELHQIFKIIEKAISDIRSLEQ